MRVFPLQNKIVASTFRGRRYGDNPQYILEQLHEINPDVQIIWVIQKGFDYFLPSYFKTVDHYSIFKKTYHYATAKVWINTHRMQSEMRKRRDQLFIETWHGGLGIKKIELDSKANLQKWEIAELKNTAKMADIFISNSNHLTRTYRNAFQYNGVIWKCGYPKNDILLTAQNIYPHKIKTYWRLPEETRIMVYAPTFREGFSHRDLLSKVYTIDLTRIKETLEAYWGGKWTVLVKWHPVMKDFADISYENVIINATSYQDMQKLILAADAFISDYSSCIFDAALRRIPCFTYAADFEDYKKDRGVYYEMEELPFPYAKNNDELIQNIQSFDMDSYLKRWDAFTERCGLYESGHAAKDIAFVINEFIKGNKGPLRGIQSD